MCERAGEYCLIGGLAVNCYVEPVYRVDADLVVVSSRLQWISENLRHSVNARRPGSDLRIQFTTDARYQHFPSRATRRDILGSAVRVASVASVGDVLQGKL